MLVLFARFVAVVGVVLSLAAPLSAEEGLKGKAATDFLDSLHIPVNGMAAVKDVIGKTVVLPTGDGYEIYRFRDMGVAVERPAPHFDRISGKYKAGAGEKSVCFDFGGRAKNYCADLTLAKGTFYLSANGRELKGAPYDDGKMPRELAMNIHLQTQCLCFREIAGVAKAKGDFKSIAESDADEPHWYENDEPYYNAVLDIEPWTRPCLVNEGGNFIYCAVAELRNPTAQDKKNFQATLSGLISKCFGRKAAGPSPIKRDSLRGGTVWYPSDTLAIYAMEGAYYENRNEQLYLVSFYAGRRK